MTLTSRKLVRAVHHAIRQIDGGQRLLGHLPALRTGNSTVNQRQLNVVQSGSPREQVEGLKYEANFLVPDAGQLVVVHFRDILAVKPVLSL